jgi:hypothetical protein
VALSSGSGTSTGHGILTLNGALGDPTSELVGDSFNSGSLLSNFTAGDDS